MSGTTAAIIDEIQKAVGCLEKAYEIHCTESRVETIHLPRLVEMLRSVTAALEAGDYARAREIFGFSTAKPAALLATHRWKDHRPAPRGPQAEPATMATSETARVNGRKRVAADGSWTPYDNKPASVMPRGEWHRAQARILLGQIQLVPKFGGEPVLEQLIEHRVSVRIEREAAILLREEAYKDVLKLMPPRWQPRSYYSGTARALNARRNFIKRRVLKGTPRGQKFFLRVDYGRGAPAIDFGPFSKPDAIDNVIVVGMHESEVFFRKESDVEWSYVGLPVFQRRPRHSAGEIAEFQRLCEKNGRNSVEVETWVFQVWKHNPSASLVRAVTKTFGKRHPLVVGLTQRPRHIKVQRTFVPMAEVSGDDLIDDRPSSDPRISAKF